MLQAKTQKKDRIVRLIMQLSKQDKQVLEVIMNNPDVPLPGIYTGTNGRIGCDKIEASLRKLLEVRLITKLTFTTGNYTCSTYFPSETVFEFGA